jgi:hypothetical protein
MLLRVRFASLTGASNLTVRGVFRSAVVSGAVGSSRNYIHDMERRGTIHLDISDPDRCQNGLLLSIGKNNPHIYRVIVYLPCQKGERAGWEGRNRKSGRTNLHRL